MRYTFLLFAFSLMITSAFAQNVMISNLNFPNEPAIIMDPERPHAMLAAANINNYYLSQDTGRTWSTHTLSSDFGVWGDPAFAVDTAGDFYFFHLSNPPNGNWIDRIVCQKTTDDGQTWNNGSYTGLNGTKAQDKEWPIVDCNTNTIYLTWTQFDEYGSANPNDSSVILFSKSTDAGLSWTPAKRINHLAGDCIDSDNTVEGALPAVGPNGEVYVSWAGPNGLVFNRSLDGGETWLPVEIPIDPMPTGWDYTIPGINRANGLPITLCDLSNGPNRGTIYVNWSDQRNGAHNTDVWLSKSTDGGDTWSAPVRVNDDVTETQQFFTWMAIDQVTGNLFFVFYDRREQADNTTDVYMAATTDGGQTFINRKISESPFVPVSNIFFGDYTNIVAHNGIIRPIWTRLNNGQLSIWTHLTDASDIITATEEEKVSQPDPYFEAYPNPSGDYFFVSYKLHTISKVSMSIINPEGKVILRPMRNVKKGFGKYVERIDLNDLSIPAGLYFIKLEIDGQLKTLHQIIIK
jgi:hypothetical protein